MGSVEQWTAHFKAMANNELPPGTRHIVRGMGGGPAKTFYKVKAVQQPPIVSPVQQVVEVQQPPIVSPVQQVVEQAEAKVNQYGETEQIQTHIRKKRKKCT
jgi:hypothetical protein